MTHTYSLGHAKSPPNHKSQLSKIEHICGTWAIELVSTQTRTTIGERRPSAFLIRAQKNASREWAKLEFARAGVVYRFGAGEVLVGPGQARGTVARFSVTPMNVAPEMRDIAAMKATILHFMEGC